MGFEIHMDMGNSEKKSADANVGNVIAAVPTAREFLNMGLTDDYAKDMIQFAMMHVENFAKTLAYKHSECYGNATAVDIELIPEAVEKYKIK